MVEENQDFCLYSQSQKVCDGLIIQGVLEKKISWPSYSLKKKNPKDIYEKKIHEWCKLYAKKSLFLKH